jgi:hypothetical protein
MRLHIRVVSNYSAFTGAVGHFLYQRGHGPSGAAASKARIEPCASVERQFAFVFRTCVPDVCTCLQLLDSGA